MSENTKYEDIRIAIENFRLKLLELGVDYPSVRCESISEDVYSLGKLEPHTQLAYEYTMTFRTKIIGVNPK